MLFAISDLHLGFYNNKTMDIFGEKWYAHAEKIKENWLKRVTPEDTVLVCGDVSWGMRLNEADVDLIFLEELPGKKILVQGNHDYWWSSTSLLNAKYKTISFIKNSFDSYKDIGICGCRGWLCPNDGDFTAHDKKIYLRELMRLSASLNKAVASGFKELIVMMHFPPAVSRDKPSGFTELIGKYNVRKVIYGHLHGEDSFFTGINGFLGGTEYILAAADYIGFSPIALE